MQSEVQTRSLLISQCFTSLSRGLAHDSRGKRGSVVQNKGWPVRQSLNLEASTSFDDWKALIVTRCFELGIAVAGIDEHLLYSSMTG